MCGKVDEKLMEKTAKAYSTKIYSDKAKNQIKKK